ncbi:hypothetical protein MASR2M36_27360 [Providencia sp.]
MRDPGLQPERTQQAWSRTLLLLALNVFLFLRSSLLTPSWYMLVGASLGGLLFLLISLKRTLTPDYPKFGLKIDNRLFLLLASFVIFLMSLMLILQILFS